MGRARELANLFSGGSADINVKTSDGGILNLQTSDTTVVANDVVGAVHFRKHQTEVVEQTLYFLHLK